MSARGNQFKTNSFKNNSTENTSGKSGRARKPVEKAEYLPKFDLQDGRAVKVFGLFFIVLSLYFLIAFTSYLFSWQDDQSYVIDANGGWSNLFKTTEELKTLGVNTPVVQNWLGKFGALLSHQFIYEWFGISSFLFVLVFFIIGYRLLFKVRILSISRTIGYSFFCLIFFSVTLGFAHGFWSESPHFLEGEFGFWSNKILSAQIGTAGVAGLIVFAGLTVLIVAYNIDFKFHRKEHFEDDGELEEGLKKNQLVNEDRTDMQPYGESGKRPTVNERLAQNVAV
ncbi:MAG: DNA translocase FtsK 4TM domain-containing protein, partial [Pedobacter sp.]|nr:DNA translocase FtsK 4TM domain-containing protein [Pedobacter sp.]